MTIKRNILLAVAALAIASVGGLASADAARGIGQGGQNPGHGGTPPGLAKSVPAPEIDATAGVQAIALLSGILLLVGERARRRKV
jgi:hypothetical protein